jgi:hypothetical protein
MPVRRRASCSNSTSRSMVVRTGLTSYRVSVLELMTCGTGSR